MGTDMINPAIETGKSIGDFGMMAITAGFFFFGAVSTDVGNFLSLVHESH